MTEPDREIGRGFIDAALTSYAALSTGVGSIALAASEYARKSIEAGSAAAQQIACAETVDAALAAQSTYASRAYEELVAEATRLGGLYADVARDAYRPFERIVVGNR